MGEKIPLSVVILTKNEASRIAECLQSVAWAQERLVVDDGSTDSTVEIASSMGARILKRRMDLEGRHRNWAYSQARNEWVLSLDADERVTPELEKEIQRLLVGHPTCEVYAIPRRNYIGHRWIRQGGWYPSAQVKLFKRSVFQWEETTVHPRAITSSSKPWGTLQGDLIHFSYRNLEDFVEKLNRQTTLEAEKWIQDGRRMSLGKALWRTVDRFVRTFWLKRGYRDGFLGFVVAVFAGFYQFLSFAKYWHLKQGKEGKEAKEGKERAKALISPPSPDSPPFRARLSVVILTQDAAKTIQPCLSSVAWADEVIVVDGGSTDGTLALCQAAGAKLLHQDAKDNFAQLRNAGTQMAQGDWVLQLDADEVVTPAFRQALQQILFGPVFHAAYKFRRRNNFLGHWMRFGGWDHFSLHLFRRGRAQYEGRVHERLHVDGSIGTLREGVEHYPFRSLEEFVDRQNRYTSLEARQLVETQGPHPMKVIWRQAALKPVKLFWKMTVKKQGLREGKVGFIFAGLFAFVYFFKWAKVWEILNSEEAS